MTQSPPTLEDVVRLSGFSRSTVSRFLNDAPGVSPTARAAVSAAIARLGYVPSPAARELASKRTTNRSRPDPGTTHALTVTGSVHVSQVIRRSPADVYGFAADPGNLPRWATGLTHGDVYREGDALVAQLPAGPVRFTLAPRNPHGVLDHNVTLPSGDVVVVPMRVIAHPDGAEVILTHRRLHPLDQHAHFPATTPADLDRLRSVLEDAC